MPEYFYDAAGRPVSKSDASGGLWKMQFDAKGRVVSLTDPSGNSSSFSYNHRGNRLSSTDARGNTTSFTYDNMGHVTSITDPLSRQRSFTYNMGLLQTFTDAKGNLSQRSYDRFGRLVEISYGATASNPNSSESSIALTYTTAGNLSTMIDSSGPSIALTYDSLYRVTSEVSPVGAVSYTYYPSQLVSSMTTDDGTVTAYDYDANGNLLSLSRGGQSMTFAVDALGRRQSATFFNGITATFSYDDGSRVTEIDYSNQQQFVGNVTYAYDGSGRIISRGGNLTALQLPEALAGMVYDAANQLTAVGGQTRVYDEDGNLLQGNGSTYTWDEKNRLVGLATGAGVTASFDYLPDGRRFTKTINGAVTNYLYDGLTSIEERSASGDAIAQITSGGLDEPFNRTTSDGSFDVLLDAAGNVLALCDDNSTLVATYSYSPYGASSISGSSHGNTQTFDAREDDQTGLLFLRARYYDYTTGTFIQRDPAEKAGQDNPYSFVNGDPINYNDPFGLGYFAHRPLSFLEKEYGNLYHEAVFFTDDDFPMSQGFYGTGWTFFGGEVRDDSFLNYPLYTAEGPEDGFDDCTLRVAAASAKTGYYNAATNNCQDWANRVKELYFQLIAHPGVLNCHGQ